MKNIKDKDLKQLLADVATEVEGLVKGEAEKLVKAAPGEETSAEVQPDTSASSDASASSAPAGDASPPAGTDGPPAGDGDADDAPPADASASAGAPPADGASGDPMADASAVDPAAIQAELAQMPIEHVRALYLAAKEVIFASLGQGAPDASAPPAAPGADAGAPPAGPPADASAPPAPDATPALKAEVGMTEHPEANGENPLHAVKKSEDAARIATLEASVGVLSKAVEVFLTTPMRKSVTSITEMPNTKPKTANVEAMSKSEIDAKLKDIVQRPDLKKSDREKISSFCLGFSSVDQIAHLFEVK
jgi:hypothetical protein